MAYGTYGANYNSYLSNSPYYGMNYQPNMAQNTMPMVQQPAQMQAQQNQYNIPIEGVIFLTSDEAKAYIVPPNKRVMIMDRDKSVFYIKSADALGQSNTSVYKFEPLVDKSNEIVESSVINSEDFVKKDDIKAFATNQDLETFKSEIIKSFDEFKKSFIKKALNNETKD